MRASFVFCVLLLLGNAIAQEQPAPAQTSPKLTFVEPAAPLGRLVPRLAELTKLPLKVTKAMETEVVLICVHDVTSDELLKHVAAATGGQWTQSDNTYYLSPSPSGRAGLNVRARSERALKIAADLKKLDPANKKPDAAPKPGEFDMSMMLREHGDEIFYRILSAIGPQQLATMLSGDRAVLSTRPTARQYSLPLPEDVLAGYIARHNDEAKKRADKAKAAAAAAGDGGDGGDAGTPDESDFGPYGGGQLIKSAPAKVLLILTRSQGMASIFGGGDLSCVLVFYDAAGKETNREGASLGSFFDAEEMQELMESATGKAKPSTEPPLELSDESKQFAKYIRTMGNATQNQKAGQSAEEIKQVKDRVAHPELYDPLAYPGDLIAAYAKSKNLQLVASMPDSFAIWLISLMMSSPTGASVEKKLAADTSLVTNIADGWLTVAPGDFRTEPMSRVDLAKMMVSFANEPSPSIDLLAAAALSGLGDPGHGMLPELWLSLSNPGVQSLFDEDWDMLRLYGTLSSDQRAVLESAKRLSVGALTEPQKEQLERMIFGASGGISMFNGEAPLHVESKRDSGSILDAADSMFNDAMEEYGIDGEGAKDYRGEPTEIAPDGIPAGAAITLKLSSSQVLKPVMEKKSTSSVTTPEMFSQPMAVDQIAGMVAMRESPQFSQVSGMYPTFNKVQIGTKRTLHFRIYVSAEAFKAASLTDCSFPPGEIYALNSLPGALQKKFDDALKQMREAYKNSDATGGDGGATPPPPPL